MNPEKTTRVPNYFWSIFAMRCPRCRTGKMFKDPNPYKKVSLAHIFDMPEHCSVCRQRYEMETGFWYGTGYVSYALTVALSTSTLVAWWVLLGISVEDNSIFHWLIFNGATLILLQPWLMRLSRVIYMRFFVGYDPDYRHHEPKEFDA